VTRVAGGSRAVKNTKSTTAIAKAVATTSISAQDIYYLKSIYRQLRGFKQELERVSLGGEVLADNVDWLDCFIDRIERA
jgi:hypothetical protein